MFRNHSRVCCRLLGVILAAALLVPFGCLHAQVDKPRTTSGHVLLSSGKKLSYTVELGRIPIRDGGSDEIRAYMFFVAYRVPSTQPRPVTFLWNGGPGSASSILHLESVGPRRLDTNGTISDFGDTALVATDLVFVDAAGTGFSRVARPEFAGQFYQMRGDVAAFTDFVRAWRLLFRAEQAPIYLAGESWGSFRATAVALGLEQRDIKVEGIVAISGRPGLPNSQPDNTLRALRTVEQAVAAQHHGKLSPELPKDASRLQDTVRDWAMSAYVPALEHLASISTEERDAIARQLSRYTGLPERDINRNTLVVTPSQFLQGLLRDQGKTLETFDMTQTADAVPGQNIQGVEHYIRQELGYVTDLAYIQYGHDLNGFSPDDAAIRNPNVLWDYYKAFYPRYMRSDEIETMNTQLIADGEAPQGQDTPDAAEAMALDAHIRLFVVNGLHDSMSSCAATREILRRQAPAVLTRIAFRCYESGHMVYADPAMRLEFSEDLQAFVTGRSLH